LKRFTENDLESTAILWSKLWVDRPVYKFVGINFDQFYPYCLRLCKQALKYDWNCILVEKQIENENGNDQTVDQNQTKNLKERVIGFAISCK